MCFNKGFSLITALITCTPVTTNTNWTCTISLLTRVRLNDKTDG